MLFSLSTIHLINTFPTPALRAARLRTFLFRRPAPDQPRSTQSRQQLTTLLTGAGVWFDYLLFTLCILALTGAVLAVLRLHQQSATIIYRRLHNAGLVIDENQTR